MKASQKVVLKTYKIRPPKKKNATFSEACYSYPEIPMTTAGLLTPSLTIHHERLLFLSSASSKRSRWKTQWSFSLNSEMGRFAIVLHLIFILFISPPSSISLPLPRLSLSLSLSFLFSLFSFRSFLSFLVEKSYQFGVSLDVLNSKADSWEGFQALCVQCVRHESTTLTESVLCH